MEIVKRKRQNMPHRNITWIIKLFADVIIKGNDISYKQMYSFILVNGNKLNLNILEELYVHVCEKSL